MSKAERPVIMRVYQPTIPLKGNPPKMISSVRGPKTVASPDLAQSSSKKSPSHKS